MINKDQPSFENQIGSLLQHVGIACQGESPGSTVVFQAAVKMQPCGHVYRVLVVNEDIRKAALMLLDKARARADRAALFDAELYAAGAYAYGGEAGRTANEAVRLANRCVAQLQQLSEGHSEGCLAGPIDVYAWRKLLRYFGESQDTGSSADLNQRLSL